MNETSPLSWLPWCWKLMAGAIGSIGRFTRLGPVPAPLPLATITRLPSAVVVTNVGYQPVGKKPSIRLLPCSSMSTTAIELLSALATYSVSPSGDNANEFGVLPAGALG